MTNKVSYLSSPSSKKISINSYESTIKIYLITVLHKNCQSVLEINVILCSLGKKGGYWLKKTRYFIRENTLKLIYKCSNLRLLDSNYVRTDSLKSTNKYQDQIIYI